MIKKLLLLRFFLPSFFHSFFSVGVNPLKVKVIQASALPASEQLFPAELVPTSMQQGAVFTFSIKLSKPLHAPSQRSFGVNGSGAFWPVCYFLWFAGLGYTLQTPVLVLHPLFVTSWFRERRNNENPRGICYLGLILHLLRWVWGRSVALL